MRPRPQSKRPRTQRQPRPRRQPKMLTLARLWLSKRMVAKSRARRTSRRKSRRRTRLPHDMIDRLRVPVARGTLEAADQVGRTRDAFETCCERTFRWGQHGHAQPHGVRRAMRMAHAGCRINVGMRLREASERGDRRRAVSSRCGTWAPGPVCVWIAADADGSGSARHQDQTVTSWKQQGCGKTRIRFVTEESK